MKKILLQFKFRKLNDAVIRNDIAFIKEYISLDLNIDSTDELGNTALYTACDALNAEAVELLLRAGANPHLKNKDDRTPLCVVAIKCNTPESVRILDLLIDYKTDLTQEVYPRPIESAILNKNYYFVQKLMKDNSVWVDIIGESYLHIACMRNDPDIAYLLLDKISPNIVNNFGNTPLHFADVETIPHLLAAGADRLKVNEDGKTPLMVFVEKQNLNAVKILIELTPCTDTLSAYRASLEKLKINRNMTKETVYSIIDKKINYISLESQLAQKPNIIKINKI